MLQGLDLWSELFSSTSSYLDIRFSKAIPLSSVNSNSVQSIRLILTREIRKNHANMAVILCENNFECIRRIAMLILKEELLNHWVIFHVSRQINIPGKFLTSMVSGLSELDYGLPITTLPNTCFKNLTNQSNESWK